MEKKTGGVIVAPGEDRAAALQHFRMDGVIQMIDLAFCRLVNS